MNEKEAFIKRNYSLIKKHFDQEAKEMGYKKSEYNIYFKSCKCSVFVGTLEELNKETAKENYFIIKQEDNFVIAEMFNGLCYNFI